MFVFCSLVWYFSRRAPFFSATLLAIPLWLLCSDTAECSPGNDRDDASSSVTEAPTKPIVEDQIQGFLSQYGKKAPQPRIFDELKRDLKFSSATQEDLVEINRLITTLGKKAFRTPSEAASQLAIDFDKYYWEKYKKHSID